MPCILGGCGQRAEIIKKVRTGQMPVGKGTKYVVRSFGRDIKRRITPKLNQGNPLSAAGKRRL